MYTIEFYNKDIGKKEILKYKNLKKALVAYYKISNTPWWECDISDLKFKINGEDIVRKIG